MRRVNTGTGIGMLINRRFDSFIFLVSKKRRKLSRVTKRGAGVAKVEGLARRNPYPDFEC